MPSSNSTRSRRSVTGEAIVTCSLARAVPTASITSTKLWRTGGVATTSGGGGFLRSPPPLPQPDASSAPARQTRMRKVRPIGLLPRGGLDIGDNVLSVGRVGEAGEDHPVARDRACGRSQISVD